MYSNNSNNCRFYGSMIGCRNGSECQYSHSNPNSVPFCHFSNHCRYASNCQYRHIQHGTPANQPSKSNANESQNNIFINNNHINGPRLDETMLIKSHRNYHSMHLKGSQCKIKTKNGQKANTKLPNESATSNKTENKVNDNSPLSKIKWNIYQKPNAYYIHNKVVQIGDSIWYSTACGSGEQGMVEYCLKTNKTKQIVKYKDNSIKLEQHSVCKYKNIIYIINCVYNPANSVSNIIEFNPMKKKFVDRGVIHEISGGWYYPSVIVDNDAIHIYNNEKILCYIYYPLTNKIERIFDAFHLCGEQATTGGCLIKYDNKLLRFGAVKCRQFINNFMVGTNGIEIAYGFIRRNESELSLSQIPLDVFGMISKFYCNGYQYVWTRIDQWKLIKPMIGFGYIIYQSFIITFGGFLGAAGATNNIYILNMDNKEKGWIKSSIKCPAGSKYRAILTRSNDIHLFGDNAPRGHYSIPLSSILDI